MINLPTTTLICVDCLNVDRAIKVIERCKSLCNFADVKLLTSLETDYKHKVEIGHLPSLIAYSIFCLKKLHEYVGTQHLLIVQRDGWILNPDKWESSWTQYDYIGALFNQHDLMGVGGFSFRSKALMESIASKYPDWDGTDEHANILQEKVGLYEDGAIAIVQRKQLQNEGFKFASLEVGAKFSAGGNPNHYYYISHPFGFHGSWRSVDQETGFVGSEIKHDGVVPEPI